MGEEPGGRRGGEPEDVDWSGPVPEPDSVAQVELDLVFENGDEQHDGEAQQDAGVLKQEEATVADALLARVVVQHLRHLGVKGHQSDGFILEQQQKSGLCSATENNRFLGKPNTEMLKVTYCTTRCEGDQPLQAVLKICLF